MSRSKHHGCGGACGVCKPHKKWPTNSPENLRPSVRRKLTAEELLEWAMAGEPAESDLVFFEEECLP